MAGRQLQGLQIVQYEGNPFIVEKRGAQIWHLPDLQLSLQIPLLPLEAGFIQRSLRTGRVQAQRAVHEV